MTNDELVSHYVNYGKEEGRQSNLIKNRQNFIDLIESSDKVLEIGPFCHPACIGSNVSYADFFNSEELKLKAGLLGYDKKSVPVIKYILKQKPLSEIQDKFDLFFSSHCIEHQIDFIQHLIDVENLLANNGKVFLIIPDKRYCFDRYLPLTTIADIIDAHHDSKRSHSLKNIIEHRALTTHNDARRHWLDKNINSPMIINSKSILNGISEWQNAGYDYVDVHAWKFTPDSFEKIMSLLLDMSYVNLKVERIYPTLFGSNEFFAVLKVH